MTKKIFILDVSGFIFRAYFALPHMSNPQGESTNALYGFIRSILKLMNEFDPQHMVAVYDGPEGKRTRKEIYEKYKAHRDQIAEDLPEQIERSKVFCDLFGIQQVELEGVEADDTMGSIALWAKKQGAKAYLCTSDKDLCQLVDKHIFVVNPWKENLVIDSKKVEEIYGVTPKQIIDYLAIMGDASDNIPGLKGFGPKTAVTLLQEFGTLENILAHPERVKGQKKQEILREDADIARLSQKLATLQTDLKFPDDGTFFSLCKPDIPALKEFYIQMGFNTLVRELEKESPEEAVKPKKGLAYHLVDDEAGLKNLIELLSKQKEISFDTETTHIRPLLADPVGIGFCFKEAEAYYLPLNGKLGREKALSAVRPIFENPEIGFYAHNAKYDIHVLANVGVRVANLCFDTILASYLLNSASRRHSLDNLALHYFGKVKIPIKSLIGAGKKEITMDRVPIPKVCEYCCEDVDYTLRIKKILEKELKERKLSHLLFDLELPMSHVLAKMERMGMYLDTRKLEHFSQEVTRGIANLEKQIFTLAGKRFNLNSPRQLAEILFDKLGIKPLKKTATGYSTKAEVLEALAEEHPIAVKILDYRTLEKLRSTYIEALPGEVNPHDQRVHPTFNQFIAATGRLACQDPNLQNIPVRTEQGRKIRAAFRPQEAGWSYLSADYSQIELRLLAHLSEDSTLIGAFKRGEDIHSHTASLMFGVPNGKVSKLQRHQAKAINFGIIYGQQAYGLSRELGIDVKEAAEFIKAYFERYPKVFDYIANSIQTAKKSGKTVTLLGREREIPEIHSSNTIVRNAAERLAVNSPLQGFAADLIKIAMLEIDKLLVKNNFKSYLVLQIHDELIFEAPDSELERLTRLVKREMESVFSLKVPLIVDVSIGKNWAEC